MVLLAEHGLNVSTFVARIVASAQNDLYAAIDAAPAARLGAGVRARALAEAVAAYIIEQPHFQARKLYPNVEFYSAPLLYQLGLPLDAFALAFAMARMPGAGSATSASSSPWPAWFAPRPSMSARPRAPSSPWRIASSAEG